VNAYWFLGTVQQGRFTPLLSEHDTGDSYRLTTIPAQSTEPPESGEIPLVRYDGNAVMVRGIDRGEWIHSAVVVEEAGPILSTLVRHVFGQERKGTP
jgi:hypothetical protein